MKLNPDPVFFMSFVGVDIEGLVKEHEHIFDIYTKLYDFLGCDVKLISAQDLWDFYKSKHPGADRKKINNVYSMAKFFVDQHSNGHFIVDECPFKETEIKYKSKNQILIIKIGSFILIYCSRISFRLLKYLFILKFRLV